MATPILTVATDGSGLYKFVQEAIDAVPVGSNTRTEIHISPGTYEQPVYVPKNKNLITLRGLGPREVVLTWHNTATSIHHPQPPIVIGEKMLGCGSVIVDGDDFIAENITFENTGPLDERPREQAVALRASGDRIAFYNCKFLGWQDTLHLHLGRHYLRDCYIEGSVDFIFGNSCAILEHCHIHCKSYGFITAHSRHSVEEATGFVFLGCVITGTGSSSYTWLGRIWNDRCPRVIFAYTHMDGCVKPEGWDTNSHPDWESTSCFYEYRCTGPGSGRSSRVSWSKELGDEEASLYMYPAFIDSDPQNRWLWQKMGISFPMSA